MYPHIFSVTSAHPHCMPPPIPYDPSLPPNPHIPCIFPAQKNFSKVRSIGIVYCIFREELAFEK